MKCVLGFALAALMAVVCGRLGPLPQVAKGGDVLSVAFGDARAVLSRALYHKADSYFHGGVDGEHHEHDHETPNLKSETSNPKPDPWRWINARIRAPQVERHLEGDAAVEMMPWFWASVKSDPHNVEAWTAAWYAAAHVMRDEALAGRVLDEAKAKNPRSAEIAFTEGRHRYKMGKGDAASARVSFETAKRLLLSDCGGDLTRLSERDRQLYDFTCNYLRRIVPQ